MEAPKREFKTGGIVKLAPNVKPAFSTIDRDILVDVEPDDQEHMAMVIDYCSTTICSKHETIKIFIHTARHEKTGETLLYTAYIGMPLSTVMEDDYMTNIKQFSWRRITRPMRYMYDAESQLMRLEIYIHPMRLMQEIDDIQVVNIHIKQRRLNIIHEKSAADEDKRGSTKRPRREADIDK